MATQNIMPETDPTRRAARKLLAHGLASPAEAARLAGVSRQLMNHWAEGINWRKARNAHLAKAWRARLRQS